MKAILNYKFMAYKQEIFTYVTKCSVSKTHSDAQIFFSC